MKERKPKKGDKVFDKDNNQIGVVTDVINGICHFKRIDNEPNYRSDLFVYRHRDGMYNKLFTWRK